MLVGSGIRLIKYWFSVGDEEQERRFQERMNDPRDVLLRPVVSEKSYALLDQGVYTFIVHPDANKIEIRQAVESIFNVQVVKVNTLNRKGKRKRMRRAATFGRRADTKRAVVTLAEGQHIPLFES